MSYSCQFCGALEESEVELRCGGCGGEKIVRNALKATCGDCEDGGTLQARCPHCGSEELED